MFFFVLMFLYTYIKSYIIIKAQRFSVEKMFPEHVIKKHNIFYGLVENEFTCSYLPAKILPSNFFFLLLNSFLRYFLFFSCLLISTALNFLYILIPFFLLFFCVLIFAAQEIFVEEKNILKFTQFN